MRRGWISLALASLIACATAPEPTTSGSVDLPEVATPAAAATEPSAPEDPGRLRVAGCVLDVHFEGEPPTDADLLYDWVRRSAEIVAAYTDDAFPVPTLRVTIAPGRGDGVGFGLHKDGRTIRIRVGDGTSQAQLRHDWVLVHEMFHAAFPDLARGHKWMQEGLSTYLEPIARARVGELDEAYVWAKWVRMMGHGRPRLGDRGLDRTHTWGRTYWGGALFWLMADLEIRKRTDNRRSLQDAIVGILDAGGNGRADWSTARVVEAGDDATHTRALHDLYAAMAEAPGDVDLPALWAELGVVVQRNGDVEFDDTAPLAHIRRAMTGRPTHS